MKLNKSILAVFAIAIIVFSAMSVVSAEDASNETVDDNPYHNGAVMHPSEADEALDNNPYHHGAVMHPSEADEARMQESETDSSNQSSEDEIGDNPYRHGALMNEAEPDSSDSSANDSANNSTASENTASNTVNLKDYPTGNPLVVLLISAAFLGIYPLRLKK